MTQDSHDINCEIIFKTKLKVLELYSGIGGIHYAIKNLPLDCYEVIAIDINTTANSVYNHNHCKDDNCQQLSRNILSINDRQMNEWDIDLLTMSPPCQPFSRLGLRRDVDDNRSDSFVHLMNIFHKLRNYPKYVLVENVKGFETSNARQLLIQTLTSCDYRYQEYLLSPNQLNIPNSRLRYYLIAKHNKDFNFKTINNQLMTTFPSIDSNKLCTFCSKNLCFPYEISMKPIDNYLQQLDDKEIENYYLSDKILIKYFMILDIVKSDSFNTNCFTKGYSHYIEGTGSVLKTTDYDLQHICQQINECQTDSQKLLILRSLNLRFFTPKEVANLMSFPSEFDFPINLTMKQKYRLLGNSVNVKVIEFLLKLLL
ncbi:tRNA (cytosine(38)-C(5))-methyltransferase-like, partial [Oppia nitens]|uniref:tRNA (cytosine(38)-C(5))-methyltransferase-like n=1 Tax=Oppia nitens TaxID=1686743 RepID=UPI0023DAA684